MSYEKTFHLNSSMIAWPARVGVKALTVDELKERDDTEELEERELKARLAKIQCFLEYSAVNETLWSVQLAGVRIDTEYIPTFTKASTAFYVDKFDESVKEI